MIAGRSIDRRSVTAWRLIAVAAALLWFAVAAVAQTFPALTGRIVDQANVISADARRTIEPKLVDLETKSVSVKLYRCFVFVGCVRTAKLICHL